ncbi:MAG: discoidin domain-containing protein [Oscillospiraceae bacterium]|nr:discoidin domain-containing protein [Oscillospiraceae bacterium]
MIRDTAFRRAAWASASADFDCAAHLVTERFGEWRSPDVDSGGARHWVYIDLGAETRITLVSIRWGEDRAADYVVQLSNDAETWTDTDEADICVSARYVRLLCLRPEGARYSVKRIEVYGDNDIKEYDTACGWRIERAGEVKASGEAISMPSFDVSSWLPAVVPGTALVSYLAAGAIPDPNRDDWQFQVSEAFFTADFWYRKSLYIPSDRRGKRISLNFDAINWKADVYFNGRKLQNALPHREKSIEGAFIRARFDITEFVHFGDYNAVAALIYKNDTPGEVTTQGLAEGPGPNGGLLGADNPTLHASVGWDWLPTIRGRNTGIYGDFHISYDSGAVLIDPWMETDLDIREVSASIAAEDFARELDTSFVGADRDGESFVLDLGQARRIGSVTVVWGAQSGGASADAESRHAAKFKIETSADGERWANIDAHPGGEVQTPWFGVKTAEPNPGSDFFEGHAVSDSVQGATALPVVDMGAWGPGRPAPFPVFEPREARYIRFTSIERREQNGALLPTIVRGLRVYAESPSEAEQSMTRRYELDGSKARLTFRAEVRNLETRPVTASIAGVISPNGVVFTYGLTLAPGETKAVEIDNITLENPRLWWPNTYGEPFLHEVSLLVKTDGGEKSLSRFKFGVRKFTYPIDGGIMTLYCNGARIVAKGGNWGMDDGLKRDTPAVYDAKARLHAEANMTMIRNWIGMTNHPAFYDACDKYGILIWDDFWLANPVDGPEPADVPMFLENAADRIKKYRSHASLAIYCGRNEGNPSPEIDAPLRRLTETLDGTRIYFPCSAMPPVGSGGGYSLAWQGGERGIKQYFNDVTSPVLRSERGIPNVPEKSSLRRFLSPKNLWPISEAWALHDWTYHMNGPASSYMGAVRDYLGGAFEIPADNVQGQKPDENDPVFREYKKAVYKMINDACAAWSFDDFCRAAQMINFEHHRGLFEALGARRSNGLLMWMSQSSWPSLMWQTYDWYLNTNGGYFGAKAGNQPTRALWDPRRDALLVANHTAREYENAVVRAELFNLYGKLVYEREYGDISMGADESGLFVAALDFSPSDTDVVFLRLRLYDENGAVLGENTYWHNRREYQNYRALIALPPADIALSVSEPERVEQDDGRNTVGAYERYTVTVKNTGSVPAVQLALRAETPDGETVSPVFWSNNYLTLMPGETATVTAELPAGIALYINL